jgi:hypothetical protein
VTLGFSESVDSRSSRLPIVAATTLPFGHIFREKMSLLLDQRCEL